MSKLNCWPGCLAIVRALEFRDDNGKIVKVLRRAVEGERLQDGARLCFRSSETPGWIVRGTDLGLVSLGGGLSKGFTEAAFADCSLIPIQPPPGTVSEESVKKLYEPVPSIKRETESA